MIQIIYAKVPRKLSLWDVHALQEAYALKDLVQAQPELAVLLHYPVLV